MKLQRKWWIALVVVAGLVVIGGVAFATVPAMAQTVTATVTAPFAFGVKDAAGDELLAQALGITTEELSAARLKARDAALAKAVAEGRLTQEEADLMKARWAFDAFVRERMQAAYDQAVADAVAQGVVTQEQADQFTKPDRDFMFMGDGFMGHHVFQYGFGKPDGMKMHVPGERSQ